jgi:hypothetical protein
MLRSPTGRETYIGATDGSRGDAASFIDPLYSPDSDFWWIHQQWRGGPLIDRALAGEVFRGYGEFHERFQQLLHAWFERIYKDKYISGLMTASCGQPRLVDIASYHLGSVGRSSASVAPI